MNIAQVVATFLPYHGGTGNVCLHNSVELSRLGHDVTVFTSRYPKTDCQYPNEISVERLDCVVRKGNFFFIPRLATIRGFDIVHLHLPFFSGDFLTFCASKLTMSPLVITYHQDVRFGGPLDSLLRGYYRLVVGTILERASSVITPTFDAFRDSTAFGVMSKEKREDVIEIPNGVDPEEYNPRAKGERVRKEFGLQSDETVVLFVGGLDAAHYFKGVDKLLQALAKLTDEDWKLIVVGEGDMKESYRRLSQELGISERSFFAGSVSGELLPEYYRACDFLVLPSVSEQEIFGLVLLEAMASGKAVVASDLPGVRTVVHDGVDGFLVPPGDVLSLQGRIRWLVRNRDLGREMGKKGRRKVETKYNWRDIGKSIESIYLDVLEDGKRCKQEHTGHTP